MSLEKVTRKASHSSRTQRDIATYSSDPAAIFSILLSSNSSEIRSPTETGARRCESESNRAPTATSVGESHEYVQHPSCRRFYPDPATAQPTQDRHLALFANRRSGLFFCR